MPPLPAKQTYDGVATDWFSARDFLVFDAAAHTSNLTRRDFRDNMHVSMRVNNCLNARLVHTLWPNDTARAAWPWQSCERHAGAHTETQHTTEHER